MPFFGPLGRPKLSYLRRGGFPFLVKCEILGVFQLNFAEGLLDHRELPGPERGVERGIGFFPCRSCRLR